MFNEYDLPIASGATVTSTFVLSPIEYVVGLKTNTLATSGFLRVRSDAHDLFADGSRFSLPVASGQFHVLNVSTFTPLRDITFVLTTAQSAASIITLITREL